MVLSQHDIAVYCYLVGVILGVVLFLFACWRDGIQKIATFLIDDPVSFESSIAHYNSLVKVKNELANPRKPISILKLITGFTFALFCFLCFGALIGGFLLMGSTFAVMALIGG